MRGGEDRPRRGRKLPIAPEPGSPDELNGPNGLSGPEGDGETPPEGDAEARPVEPEATEGSPAAAEADADGEPSADSEAAAPELSVKEVPSWRLILTLALAGAMAGLAIVLVFGWAEPKIEAHRAAALRAAIQEVLG